MVSSTVLEQLAFVRVDATVSMTVVPIIVPGILRDVEFCDHHELKPLRMRIPNARPLERRPHTNAPDFYLVSAALVLR